MHTGFSINTKLTKYLKFIKQHKHVMHIYTLIVFMHNKQKYHLKTVSNSLV